jgi:ABC-type glycerol-3-phosphate transport system substrate-binding protein
MMKKLILFCSIALLLVCSGCKVAGISGPTAVSSKTATVPVTPPTFPATYTPAPSPTPDMRFKVYKVRGQTVTLWHPWTGARGKALEQMVRDFNDTNEYGITLQLKAWGGMEELLAALNTQDAELPQIAVLAPEVIQQQAASGSGILDLQTYIHNEVSAISTNLLTDLPDGLTAPVEAGQAVYGLPARVDAPVLIYNQTWAQQLGFPYPPATWKEFRDQVCSAAQANNKSSDRSDRGTGGWLEDHTVLTGLGWVNTLGGALPFSSATADKLNTPALEKTFTDLKQLSLDGCSWQGRNPTPYEYFNQRKALVISLPADKVQAFKISMDTMKNTDAWLVLSYPQGDGLSKWTPGTGYYSILPSSVDADLSAWLAIRWLTESKQEIKLALSDGSLPASRTGWSAVQSAGTLPDSLVDWLATAGDPAIPPYLPEWNSAHEVFQDGFYQILQSSVTLDQVDGVLTGMDSFLSELEITPTEWTSTPTTAVTEDQTTIPTGVTTTPTAATITPTVVPSTSTPTVPATPTPAKAAGGLSSSKTATSTP